MRHASLTAMNLNAFSKKILFRLVCFFFRWERKVDAAMLALSLLCFTLSMHTFHHCYLNGVLKVSEPKPKAEAKVFAKKRKRKYNELPRA